MPSLLRILLILICLSNLAQSEDDIPLLKQSKMEKESVDLPFFDLYEIAIGSGYGWGRINGEGGQDHFFVPTFFRVGFRVNHLIGFDDDWGNLQVAVEPFFDFVKKPSVGENFGATIFIRYDYPIFSWNRIFLEVGAGPMYLGFDNVRQPTGFSFLDQMGGGMQFNFTDKIAVYGGYRFRHLSHGGLRNELNSGINAHAVVGGIAIFY